ncbi:MAG: DUF465 domain-containing protein [Campylobacteraceae bacterium]|nr:DUF465 domain-containing protein [Campylobacteraceae bacterium]
MLHEYRDIISEIKTKNAHFAKIFERHNELDKKIEAIDNGKEFVSDNELDTLKKEKLKLKDEAYIMIMEYKKENNL